MSQALYLDDQSSLPLFEAGTVMSSVLGNRGSEEVAC